MALVSAAATLQGGTNAIASGDLFVEVAAFVSGDAATSSAIGGTFVGSSVTSGDASAAATGGVGRSVDASVAGDGAFAVGGPLWLMSLGLSGEAVAAAPAVVALDAGSAAAGDASTVAPASVLVGVASAVTGDGGTTSDGLVDHPAGAVVGGDAQVVATALREVEGASTASGDASVAAPFDVTRMVGADPAGDALVDAPSSVLFQGSSVVQGDAQVGSSALLTKIAEAIGVPPSFSFKSVLFDGADEYVTTGDVLGYEYNEAFSISCWFRTSASPAAAQYMASKMVITPDVRGYYFGLLATGELRFGLFNTVSLAAVVSTSTGGFNDGEWHHAVCAYSGSGVAAGMALYVDGAPQSLSVDDDDLGSGTILNAGSFNISGRSDDSASPVFDGNLDEVAVYGKELTPTEVEWLYNDALPNDLGDVAAPSDLASWFRMGDGDTYPTLYNQVSIATQAVFPTIPNESGLSNELVLEDASGNGLDGTMTNMESTDIVYGGPYAYAPVNEPIQAIYDDTYYWLFDSNNSLGGVPSVTQFDGAKRMFSWTVGGTASEMFLQALYDGTDIWVGGNDASGNAQLKRMTTSTPPTFSSGYSVSSNSFIAMVYGGGYLWVADSAGIWRVDPANPSGPHTSVATLAGVIDLFFDDDTTNYGDSQPRLWALTDETGDRSIHRYELATPAQDDVLSVGGSTEPRAIMVGGGSVYVAYWNGSSNAAGEWTPDPIAFTNSSTSIQSYIQSRLLDIQWDSYNSRVVILGRYQSGDQRERIVNLRSDGTLNIDRAAIGDGAVWSSGAHPRMLLVSNAVYCPCKDSVSYRLAQHTLSYLYTPSYLQATKLPQYTRQFLRFGGTDEFVDMGDVLSFERTDAFSLSCWVKTAATGHYFMSKQGDSPLYRGYALLCNGSGYLEFSLYNDQGANELEIRNNDNNWWNDGQWHHLCVTLDGSGTAAGVGLFIDNVAVATTVVHDNLSGTILNSYAFRLGHSERALYFVGDIDECAVYDKELSADEVAAIFNYGAPVDLSTLGSATNLQAWWRMGEGIGAYNGTMIDMEAADNVSDVPRSSFCKYSLEFPYNANEYYDMGDVHGFEYTDSFSISCWFKTTAPSGRSMYLVFKIEGSAPYRGYELHVWGVNGVRFDIIHDTGTSDRIDVHTNNTFHDGEWHHALVTWAGSVTPVAADVVIYIDGVAQAVTVLNDSLTGSILNTVPFSVGNRADTPTQYVDGRLTEVSVWDKTLTAPEAAWVYNQGLPRDLVVGESTASLLFDEAENHSLSGGDIIHDIDRDADFSFSIWFKTSNTTSPQCLFGKTAIWDGYPHGWQIGLYPSGVIWIWMLYTWSPSNQLRTCTSSSWADGNWHHLVWTHDTSISGGGKKADCKVYIDGVLQTLNGTAISQIDTLATNVDGAHDFRIGDVVVNFYTFDGNLDEAAIYKNKVLSADEVQWLAGSPSDLKAANAPSGLHAWWKLGETLDGQRLVREETDGVADYYSPLTTSIDLNNGVTNQVIDFASVPEADFVPGEPFSFGIWVKSPMPPYDPYPVAARTDTLVMKHRTGGADRGYCVQAYYHSVVAARPELTVKAAIEQATAGSWYSFDIEGWAWEYNRGDPWWDDVWHLVLVRWNGSEAQVWTDAQRRGEGQVTGPSGDPYGGEPVADGHLLIGNHDVGGSEYGEGNVCHTFIYNKALTPDEVRAIHNEGVPPDLSTVGPTANLVFWSALGDGDAVGADNVLDLSGNDNHGTFTNGDSGDFVSEVPPRTRDLTRAGKDSWWNGTPGAPTGDIPSVSTDVPGFSADLAGWWRCGTEDNPFHQLRDVAADPTVEATATAGVKDVSRYNAHTALVNMSNWTDISTDNPGGVATYSLDLNSEVDYFSYKYLDFSGYGLSHVDMGDVLGFERDQPFSVSFWLRNQSAGNPDYFLGKMEGSTTYRGWAVTMDVNEYLTFDITSDSGAGNKISVQVQTALPSSTNFNTTYQFLHIVIAYDGSSDAGGVAIYYNGSPQTVVALTNNLTATTLTTAAFQLANLAYNTSSTYRLRGDMDEVSVYNKALSSGEAGWIYNSGVPNDLNDVSAPSNLVSWYRMGDGDTLPTIADNAGSNDGTVNNTGYVRISNAWPPGHDKFNEQLYDSTSRVSHHFENSRPFMWSFWIKTTTEIGTIIHSGSPNSQAYAMGIYLSEGRIYYAVNDTKDWWASTTYGYTIRSTNTVNDGAWHHVMVGQYRKAGANIWIDGVAESRVTLANALVNSIGTSAPLMIGGMRMNYQPLDGLRAKLAEVSVWSGYMGQDGVDAVYNGGSPPDLEATRFSKRLKGWWRMGTSAGNPGAPVNYNANYDHRKRGDAPGEEAWSTRALDFDGSNDYLNISNRYAYEWTTPFSVSFWSKANADDKIMGIYKMATGTAGWAVSNYYTVHFQVRAEGSGLDGWIYIQVEDRKLWMGQEWYHVCVTYDGSGDHQGVKIYVDGYPERMINYTYTAFTASAVLWPALTLGRANEGVMDEVAFYNKELTEAEALELFNGGVPADLENHSAWDSIESWWRMGEATANGTMIDMEAEDIVADVPTVQAGGGSNFTARALADDEIAGDMYGSAAIVGGMISAQATAASLSGDATVGTNNIVRPEATAPLPETPETAEPEIRYVGFQPNREPLIPEPRVIGVLTDPEKIRRQNREAERKITPVRRDTGTSSIVIKKK